MCNPMMIISAVSNGLRLYSSMQQQSTAREQQIRQNAIAKQNRINKETAENFKIRQKAKDDREHDGVAKGAVRKYFNKKENGQK